MINNLNINLTAKVQCTRDWSWDSDTNGWSGYHIWCVDKGGAQIESGSKVYHLFPGDIFIFDFNYRYLCTHNPENPLKVTTIYFSGDLPVLKKNIISQDTFLCNVVHKVVDYDYASEKELALMWLYPIVAELVKGPKEKKEINEKIKSALVFLEEKNFHNFTLEELAGSIGYSKNQFIRIFKQNMGKTPIQYCLAKRIEQAKSMLLYSNMTITEISYNLGFYDTSYFTRLFKQHTACSPSQYKKMQSFLFESPQTVVHK